MVDLSAPINARQLEVLRWIADGCPDGVMNGFTYETTAVALQGRRLVVVSRKGGAWRAAVTEAGRYYAQHGTHPDGPRPRPAPRPVRASAPRGSRAEPAPPGDAGASAELVLGPPRPTVEELAQSLVSRVVAAGGVLEVGIRRGGYDDLLAAARRAPGIPPGKQLRSRPARRWSPGRQELYFAEDFPARVTERPVPVPARVTPWHPAAAAYRADADRHEVTKHSLGRACRILHALAAEADRRGYQATAAQSASGQYNSSFASSLKDGQLRIRVEGFEYGIRIREQGAGGGGALPYHGNKRDRLPRWRAVKHTEFIPTGKLQITLEHGYSRDSRPAEFRDTRTLALEIRLPAILREIEIRALEDAWKRQEEEREAQDKRLRWEKAMEQARHDYQQAHRAEALASQLQRWKQAKDLGTYLDQMQQTIDGIADERARQAAALWLAWAAKYRADIDPLQQPLTMPPDSVPQPEDLRPFLRGWNPYGPDAYR